MSITYVLAAAMLLSCGSKDEDPLGGWTGGGNGDDTKELPIPQEMNHRVVAHRGACAEYGLPDNSLASLRKAIEIDCWASECDIYITKDDKVVVAHAESGCLINGLKPWENTLSALRAAGKLSNGEQLPELEDFIDVVLGAGTTRLWLDVKNILVNDISTEEGREASARVCERACEIITGKGAQNFCEFIVTGNNTTISSTNPTTIWKRSLAAANKAGIKAGWMSYRSPAEYVSGGYKWINCTTENLYYRGSLINKNGYSLQAFIDAGLDVSVYNADTDTDMEYYLGYKNKMYAICTNYPAKLIGKW